MIKILNTGMIASFQDLGRFGFRNYGVPVSGAMDQESYLLCNALLNNESNAAVIEFALKGPKIEFLSATFIAVTGAQFSLSLNNIAFPLNKVVAVNKGDVLSLDNCTKGVYGYLGVAGGFQLSEIMQSKSFYPAISPSLAITKNMEIAIGASKFERETEIQINPTPYNLERIAVTAGAEFELLSRANQQHLKEGYFSVSNVYNRMGIHLQQPIVNKLSPIITSAVLAGTVQLTPSGKMIVLMRDAQTTGGYPRVLQLSEAGINKMSQLKFQDRFQFRFLDTPAQMGL
jgi:biotin-dependent carboxylase-like uncharacterized protein